MEILPVLLDLYFQECLFHTTQDRLVFLVIPLKAIKYTNGRISKNQNTNVFDLMSSLGVRKFGDHRMQLYLNGHVGQVRRVKFHAI